MTVKERKNARQRERYANDAEYRDHVIQAQRDYCKTEEGREARRARKIRWRIENRETYLAQERRSSAKRRDNPVARADAVRRSSEWYRANRGRALSWRLGTYGLTLAEYVEMLRTQRNRCLICCQHEPGRRPNGKRKHLAVDHDHGTGFVRALLCSRCNLTIGRMDEDSFLLRAAADYLDSFDREVTS